jgi:hypothetical protein
MGAAICATFAADKGSGLQSKTYFYYTIFPLRLQALADAFKFLS